MSQVKTKLFLLVALLFSGACQAGVHHVKLFIRPEFLQDDNVSSIAAKFTKYIKICNIVLAKNTIHSFQFNGVEDITVDNIQHFDNALWPDKVRTPIDGFDYWVDVTRTNGYSQRGFSGANSVNGAAVCQATFWNKFYDIDLLNPNNYDDNRNAWFQCYVMLHEFGHTFGVGMGEYYSVNIVNDYTRTLPFLNLEIGLPGDPYYSNHLDMLYDPMAMNLFGSGDVGSPETINQLIDLTAFGKLSCAIMNGGYRIASNQPPDGSINYILLSVVDSFGRPVSFPYIRVYNKSGQLVSTLTAGINGLVSYNWENENKDLIKSDNARLFKASTPWKSGAAWTTFWEIQEDFIVSHHSRLVKTIVIQ